MSVIGSLAKETAIYGLSSIVGRFLNWLLVPLYVYLFPTQEYGIVSYLYSYMAVMLVILNYGMETGFFRFANRDDNARYGGPNGVYTTSLISVGTTSLLFIVLLSVFLTPLSKALLLPGHRILVWLLGVTVALDAFCNIPFAYLRYRKKAIRFAGIKMANIGINITLNIFFLLCCPWLHRHCPASISWFYDGCGGEAFGIGWIFVANIISTLCVLLMLLPQLTGRRYTFSSPLLRRMLRYSWPLLILGVAGIASQNMGQIVIPYLFPHDPESARSMVGIYGANIKIAIVMVMFTQAFRYAYEPFIFAQARNAGEDKRSAYADAMKFFVLFGLAIFLAVMFYLPVLKHFVAPAYWAGLRVVPVMMMAELFFGVFFNLSLWYKLTDRTVWGMYFSLICFVLMLVLNIWLVKAIGIPNGYMGSAWAAFISYGAVMLLSYFVGQRYYKINYHLQIMGLYTLLAAALWVTGEWLCAFPAMPWLSYTLRTLLLAVYVGVICYNENVPVASRLVHKLIPRHK